jgi:hypothetical protein
MNNEKNHYFGGKKNQSKKQVHFEENMNKNTEN